MKYKYIDLLPKPFLNDLLNNRVIPIVGAGFSKNADIPEGLSMPDWHELGQRVAEEIPEYMSDDNPIDALSYYEELYSRPKLVEFLIRELNYGNVQPGETYRAFCDLFKGIICTTNFDTLLEDTMVQAHLPVSVIATEDRLTVGGNNECKIIKLHGDFNHPEKMVITEKDYDVYIEKNPVMATYIANLFISNTMLLIGYSLDDNDYRGIWQVLHSRLGRMAQPAYCIAIGASEEKKARFQRRNIRIIDLKRGLKGSNTKANYKQVLFEFFTELKEYRDHTNDKKVKSTSEKVNTQLLIPAENNRLCFISCASSRIAQISELLNPILYRAGVTPVRLDNMLMPGDNWVDVAETAIRKSKAAIIDISEKSSYLSLEFSIIVNMVPKKELLIICEESVSLPIEYLRFDIARYSKYLYDLEPNEMQDHIFFNKVSKWCNRVFGDSSKASTDSETHLFNDARRLLRKSEYSSCIISAYSELEYLFSKRHDRKGMYHGIMRIQLNKINNILTEQDDFPPDMADKLVLVRNKIVHNGYIATEEEATKYLEFIEKANQVDMVVDIWDKPCDSRDHDSSDNSLSTKADGEILYLP